MLGWGEEGLPEGWERVNALSLPLDARRDPMGRTDALGRPIMVGDGGRIYTLPIPVPPTRPAHLGLPTVGLPEFPTDFWGNPILPPQPPSLMPDMSGGRPSDNLAGRGEDVSVWPDPVVDAGHLLAAVADEAWRGISGPGRALRGEPTTLGDVWATALDWGAMGAPMPVPDGALRANALRLADGGGETPAQSVARLLREGRAAEVTDDMMATVDPQEMMALYESGATGQPMPMDEASRLARAQEMGFFTGLPLYHGTATDFPAFSSAHRGRVTNNPGAQAAFWTADDHEVAEEFAHLAARGSGQTGQALVPLLHRAALPRRAHLDPDVTNLDVAVTLEDQFSRGVDALLWENYTTPRGVPGKNIYAIRDPEQLRSRFARFDPRLSHLANLNAGLAAAIPAGALAAYGLTDEDANALSAWLGSH